MLDVIAFILAIIIMLAVFTGIQFIGKFEFGKLVLTIYLAVNIANDLVDLLIKFLK